MQLFITILHIVLCITMILIILLQPGKEGGAALAGGSSGNQMYGPRGAGNFLGRATTVVAALFMFTSISLAWYSSARIQAGSDIEDAIERLEGSDEEVGFGLPNAAPTAVDEVTPATEPDADLPAETAPENDGSEGGEPANEIDASAPIGTPAGEASAEGTE